MARRPWAVASLLGAASALALPPLHLIPVLALALPGLLRLIGRARNWRAAAAVGFWFGLGHHVIGLYWITEAILFEAGRFWWLVPIAVPGLSAVLALFVGIPCAIAFLAAPGGPRIVALAGAWMLADLSRQFVLTGFPWNPLGSAWAVPGWIGDVFLQPVSLIGAHGLTGLTILLACGFAAGRLARLVAVLGLVVWAGFGAVRLGGSAKPGATTVVVLVQGNIAQGQKWDRALVGAAFRTYLDLTRDGVARAHRDFPGSDPVVVWPETASPFLLAEDTAARDAIAAAAGGGMALVGSVRFEPDGQPRNSLMAISAASAILATYDKWHLVPFGEYQPSWARVGVQLVPGEGFHAGSGPRTLSPAGLPPVAPLICYEAIFSGQVVDATARPTWIVNVTNDAWFGNSSGPRQHLAAARMRAVEEGLPLARAANTGISAGFDRLGREQARLGTGLRGSLIVLVDARATPPTFFARVGLPIDGLLAGALLLAGLVGPRARLQKRDPSHLQQRSLTSVRGQR